jgi:uncharacterized protein YigE (DUF2233 family)
MKMIFKLLSIFFSSLILLPAVCFSEGRNDTYKGIRLTSYRLNLNEQVLQLISKDENQKRVINASKLLEKVEKESASLLFATNAGIFDRSFKPLGLHIEDGKEIVPLNTSSGSGNFYLQPNGVFYVQGKAGYVVQTRDFKSNSEISVASQSGPLLLLNGKVNSLFTDGSSNKVIRSGVGVKDKSEAIFVISDDPINFYDFASYFKDKLNCSSALYLDGAISSMYVADLERTNRSGNFAAMFAVFSTAYELR